MKNCPKCNSENIKRTSPFARKVETGQFQEQGDQMVNYRCEDCNNEWQVKFGEDSD